MSLTEETLTHTSHRNPTLLIHYRGGSKPNRIVLASLIIHYICEYDRRYRQGVVDGDSLEVVPARSISAIAPQLNNHKLI